MRKQFLKSFFSLLLILCLGSLLITIVSHVFESNVDPDIPAPQRKRPPKKYDICKGCNVDPDIPAPQRKRPPKKYDICKGCKEVIDKVMQRYSKTWEKQENNTLKVRAQLSICCNGFDKAIITQANTKVGHNITYDGEKKRILKVTPEIFSTFAKEHPFSGKPLDTCAVVGNGGILIDSGCGDMIDSAQFVIRCNLPPLKNGFEKDVGLKTDLVTANPTILIKKYGSLMGSRRPFVDDLRIYGSSLLLLPAFSYGFSTSVCLRAANTMEDFGDPMHAVFFNPEYLESLAKFWRSEGLREVRLSTGIIVVSLALELCENVHLYGFWPFSNHPEGLHTLTNHYYDDKKAKSFHAMPAEFDHLLQLHTQGVLRLHLGDCRPNKN